MSSPARKISNPWMWPVILIITGGILLLDNFLLLGDFNEKALLPLLLVIAGAQILVRGDFLPDSEPRTFGITRGSVESATLEINSGEIDVEVRALQREGRLIGGQYAVQSRPHLSVVDNYAHLTMRRANTPWLSFTDWQLGLAQDLPWQLLVSSHIGQLIFDLSHLIIHEAFLATGFGDIRVVCPQEALGRVYLRSTLGDIHFTTPVGYNVRIEVAGSRMFKTHVHIHRYTNPEPNIFLSTDADEDAPLVEVYIKGTFGDAYLA